MSGVEGLAPPQPGAAGRSEGHQPAESECPAPWQDRFGDPSQAGLQVPSCTGGGNWLLKKVTWKKLEEKNPVKYFRAVLAETAKFLHVVFRRTF